ncbi:efflux RND transporter periplasmic adaptor subunit [Desulfosporosinus fructosivorans]|uniref:Efflux RND transporter periplasmic adaptor subunit n=1 Tax=Desulfosporosinus fructosivorans TaxID=2018669 RepID=A0A4Z0QYK8_9FIRM|nr:efflux RND transporter periplasmic adaptor subunit [Desulfosporosinus fructosivorans]TGE35520.1 efflux RND transporter periplasmic adaptor subunit [Desulfosporosinus fructosivorans]
MFNNIGPAIRRFKLTKKSVIMIVVLLVFTVSATGVVAFLGKKETVVAVAAPQEVSVKVSVAKNTLKNVTASYKATLVASQEGIVSGKVDGKVVQVMFENGKYVSQGDPLIKLDDQEIRNNIASSQAELKASESQVKSSESQLVSLQTGLQKMQLSVENAVRTYDRTKELFNRGAISKVELESAETTVSNAKSDLESAKADIGTAKASVETAKANVITAQVDLKNHTDSLADTTITAPITGILDEKSVSLGQYANIGVVLVKVKAISPIYAVVEVDQNDMSSLQVGQSAKINVGSNDVKDYDGIIKSIEASADTTSRVFKCKVEVANLDQELKPGIYAKVDIVSDQTSEVIAVTTDALSGNPGNYTVFVNDQGVARKRIVSIGQISKGLVEIKDGVKDGDSVIITNVNTLQDGDAVSVVTE